VEMRRSEPPEHQGRETYSEKYRLTDVDATFDTRPDTWSGYLIRPQFVALKWVRNVGTLWREDHAGSRIIGCRVDGDVLHEDELRTKRIYQANGGLTPYANTLPGLPELILTVGQQLTNGLTDLKKD
jgi:hypothetical protein